MNLLLVDDHPLFSAGLATALRHAHADSTTRARAEPLQLRTATTLTEGLGLAASFSPDMVLLDYHLRGSTGAQVIQAFAEQFPWIARVVISGDESADVMGLARRYGASGFISKTLRIDQMWQAIQAIASGAEWWMQPESLPDSLDARRSGHDGGLPGGTANASPTAGLLFTLRQREVLQLLSSGLNNREIANTLFISERTVKQHISDMLTKSAVANRVQLLNAVRSQGLLM
jgi:DNA-binding NarL/FixJ family response regulator